MFYLMARHELSDFAKWDRVFRSHAAAQRKAGLRLLHVMREVGDPNTVVALFSADDLAKARAFTGAPGAHEAAGLAGVLRVEISYWEE